MRKNVCVCLLGISFIIFTACNRPAGRQEAKNRQPDRIETPAGQEVVLPVPYATPSVRNESNVIGWAEGENPKAPEGFTVSKFAGNLDNPRWIYEAPNGDVFVAESEKGNESADRITLFRDINEQGTPDFRSVYLEGLNKPFGMLVLGDTFYVANTDALLAFPYEPGATSIRGESGKKILDLPAGGYNNHWTRNIIANEDGSKIYISVGSASNVGEYGMDNEVRRACILEINPDGLGERIYASGLRNPVGMDWAPGTPTLWTAVNERDKLGDGLVPDYITSVREGGFYGWPYVYFGPHEDPEWKGEKPGMAKKTLVPDLAVGSHTASLGLTFYTGDEFPEKYHNGAFIGQRGSWNHSELVGYKVVFVPFQNGNPAGEPEDFLTGFIADRDKSEVHGRPVGVMALKDGSLLVADDEGNTVWRVTKSKLGK